MELLGLEDLEATINEIVAGEAFQAVIYVIVAYIALIWLASAFWAYRDMRLRSASAITPYVAAVAIIVFTPVFFLFGLLIYRIVRPKETIAEVNERALAEEAMLAEVATHAQCANCSRPVHEDWIICPTCRNRLRRVCPNCEHLIELDWTLCAWCGKDFERPEAPGTAPFMPTARPAPRPQQPAPRLPVRPPPPPPLVAQPAPAPTAPAPGDAAQSNPVPPKQPQTSSAPAPRSSRSSSSTPAAGQPPSAASSSSGQSAGGAQSSGSAKPPTGI
jgi:RNA polymerase subunit RPABC4/transcription elongation factor Spt4